MLEPWRALRDGADLSSIFTLVPGCEKSSNPGNGSRRYLIPVIPISLCATFF
jgi:hypothetical protein